MAFTNVDEWSGKSKIIMINKKQQEEVIIAIGNHQSCWEDNTVYTFDITGYLDIDLDLLIEIQWSLGEMYFREIGEICALTPYGWEQYEFLKEEIVKLEEEKSNHSLNLFEELCVMASQKNFCWKLYCTTCGNSEIRFGFMKIAQGSLPKLINWEICKNSYEEMKIKNWSEEMETNFTEEISKVSIDFISTNCKFPDWLGYLGLILYMFHLDFKKRELLSQAWKPQLDHLVKERNSENLESLKQISLLSWENLENYESALSVK